MSILPDAKIGISVFINKDKCPLTRVILYYLIDKIFVSEQTDWSKRFKREAFIKRSWLSNCINHIDALEKVSNINEEHYSNKVYGVLKIFRSKQCDLLFIKVLNTEYSFYSVFDEWYVFHNDHDFLLFRTTGSAIYVKFAIYSEEIEFKKMIVA